MKEFSRSFKIERACSLGQGRSNGGSHLLATESVSTKVAEPRFYSLLRCSSSLQWLVVESEVAESAEGTVLIDTQKKELEEFKLKDHKAKNYLFQAIDLQSPSAPITTAVSLFPPVFKVHSQSQHSAPTAIAPRLSTTTAAVSDSVSDMDLKTNLLSVGQLQEKGKHGYGIIVTCT
ncbi:hypothetical protein JRO89_XSUnG0127200 [Xanthoceras sorbifolium]|uniref:Uncharacterized protein n=1 Tax=Xanthoceras sorbifolium TaxID=99658 RepID=A0ABQ8GYA4_9ROSI|nr:hypothetical protein JRO89_XSUnG0127200 [Xanthoceras sorbifolium]